jgi:hypothetical protein
VHHLFSDSENGSVEQQNDDDESDIYTDEGITS